LLSCYAFGCLFFFQVINNNSCNADFSCLVLYLYYLIDIFLIVIGVNILLNICNRYIAKVRMLQWTRQFWVIDSSESPLEKNFFFPNDILFRYFDYPVIFPNLLAASKVMLCWLNLINQICYHEMLDCTASWESEITRKLFTCHL